MPETYAMGAYAKLKSKFLYIVRVQLWAESIFPNQKVVMVYYFFPPKWLLRFVTNSIIHLIVPYFLDFHVLHCKFDLQFDPTMLYSHSILENWVRGGWVWVGFGLDLGWVWVWVGFELGLGWVWVLVGFEFWLDLGFGWVWVWIGFWLELSLSRVLVSPTEFNLIPFRVRSTEANSFST